MKIYNDLKNPDDIKLARRMISGEGLTSVGFAAIDNAHLIIDSISRRLRDERYEMKSINVSSSYAEASVGGEQSGLIYEGGGVVEGTTTLTEVVVPAAEFYEPRYNVWVSGYGGKNKLEGTSGRADYGSKYRGVTLGVDYKANSNLLVGVSGGYVKSDFNMSELLTSADVDTYAVLAYARYKKDNWWVNGTAGYRWDKLESKRSIVFPIYEAHTKGKSDGKGFLGFLRAGYDMPTNFATISPYVGVDVITVKFAGFTETGGKAANLVIGDNELKSIQSRLGVRVSKDMNFGDSIQAKLEGSLTWLHEFGDIEPKAKTRLLYSNVSFNAIGAKRVKDRAEVGLRAVAGFSKNFEAYIGYEGTFGKKWKENTGVAGVRVKW